MIKHPTRVTFFHSDLPSELAVVEAFGLGVEAHGGKFRQIHLSQYTEESGPDDFTECAVLFKVKDNTRKIFFDHLDAGCRVIHVDDGYLDPIRYHKVSLDAFHPTEYFRVKPRPPDRWEHLGLEMKPWKDNLLKHILIVNDHPIYGHFWYKIDMATWAKKIARRIKGRTFRPVRWYPVGRDWMKKGDLETEYAEVCGPGAIWEELLRTAHSVVVFASAVAVEAIVAGVPVFTYNEDCVAKSMSGDPRFVEAPKCPKDGERLQFLSDLAYTQWTAQEMWSGECWEALWM